MAETSKSQPARPLDRQTLATLLAPLNDPLLPADQQAAITDRIRRSLTHLGHLAGCDALPPTHSLRVAAAALWPAFQAVTSGPVGEDALALLEVSRQSPLAPWKMLVRAIAAWYRREDALCRKYLSAVDPDSAPARLIPALQALTGEKPRLTPAAARLVSQAAADLVPLKQAFEFLDKAFALGKASPIVSEITKAVRLCRATEPRLVERLLQHISVRAMMAGVKVGQVVNAMQGNSRKNANFWRLLARAHEEERNAPISIPLACAAWEEFRKHALHERWFPGNGAEEAALYLRMAELWERLPPELIQQVLYNGPGVALQINQYYDHQPPDIQALRPHPREPDLYYLSSGESLRRACEVQPCSENFGRWLGAAQSAPEYADQVAEQWAAALPDDIPPLLHLMQSAERRNALKKAYKYMARAEAIDSLNPEVRRARLRLLVSMALRHLKSKKLHLFEEDLRQLQELPQAQQGDRPAFLSALEWAAADLDGNPEARARMHATVARQLDGEVAAWLLLFTTCHAVGSYLVDAPPPLKGVAVAAPTGRVCALGDDMGMGIQVPDSFWNRIRQEVSDKKFRAPAPALLALGEAALRQESLPDAFAIAGAGLAQGPESQARFLFLRARAMPPWELDRAGECQAAAAELARRQRDTQLLHQIGEWRDEEADWFEISHDAHAVTLDAGEIEKIVAREAKHGIPKEPRFTGGFSGRLPGPGFPMPPGLPRELLEMIQEVGPEAVAEALGEIIAEEGPGPKRRSRRRGYIFDDDLPF